MTLQEQPRAAGRTGQTPTSVAAAPSRRRRRVTALLEQYGLAFLLVIIVAYFAVDPATRDTFPSSANISVLLASQSVLAIVALGAMIPLIAGEFDLSTGAITALCAVVSAAAMTEHGAGVVVGVMLAVAVGGTMGLLNGVVVCYLRVTSIIATLGTSTLIGGIVSQYTAGASIVGIPAKMTEFGSGELGGLPNAFLVLVGVSLITAYVLHWIPMSRYLSAIGASRQTAILLGIPVVRLTVVSYVLSGVFAGVAAALLVARTGGANPTSGLELTLPALAAVFLGATVVAPGRFNVLGLLIALFFLAALSNGLTLMGAPDYVQAYVNGGALIVGVAFSALLAGRRRGSHAT